MRTALAQNVESFFNGLEFEEISHRYSLDSKSISISVSKIVEGFKKPFDTDGKSFKKAMELGISQEEVLTMWDKKKIDACDLGHKVHSFGENYTFYRSLKPSNGYEEAIVKFWNCLPPHIIPVYTELKMYHKKYMFAGTCDTLLYNTKTRKYIILDYKTNKDLFKNFGGQKLLGCFSDLLENNFNKYQIQLSLYQILFEQTGLKIEDRRIVWLKSNGTFILFKTEDFTKRLNHYLKNDYKLC